MTLLKRPATASFLELPLIGRVMAGQPEWSGEAGVVGRVPAPRLTGKSAAMRHNEAPQTAQANGRTLVGYHELDHRPALTMAGPVTAAVPPNTLRSWQRCFGSGRHGIHTGMSRN